VVANHRRQPRWTESLLLAWSRDPAPAPKTQIQMVLAQLGSFTNQTAQQTHLQDENLSDEDGKRMTDLAQRYAECMTKAMTPSPWRCDRRPLRRWSDAPSRRLPPGPVAAHRLVANGNTRLTAARKWLQVVRAATECRLQSRCG